MEKLNQKVDDFFREALQHHEVMPSDAAKEAFLKEAATITKTGKPGRKIFFGLSGFIILLVICAGFYIGRQGSSAKKIQNMTLYKSSTVKNNPSITDQKNNVHETYLHLIASRPDSKTHSSSLSLIPSSQRHLFAKQGAIKQTSGEESPTSLETTSLLTSHIVSAQPPLNQSQQAAAGIQEVLSEPVSATQEVQVQKSLSPAKADSTVIPPENSGVITLQKKLQGEMKKEKDKSSGNQKNWNLDLGGYYSPEWMFNTLEGEKYANNFGIEGTFHFSDFSIRTGAGLSITKGTNELSINYNDYLGKYNKLDSVSFTWDDSHTHLIPIYYFTKTTVWDSLMKIQNAKIIRQYTYLQIPFILGYDFWKNDYFSIGLRFGPILSILLKTEQVSDNYNPGEDRIIKINLITPDRIETYWQFMGGVNAAFKLSKRFDIEMEPNVRYYFNSVYEQPVNDRKPWSLGIRIAFQIRN